jgi:hypothetical protein
MSNNIIKFPQDGPEAQLYDALRKAIHERGAGELSYAAIIGVLEIIKADVIEDGGEDA